MSNTSFEITSVWPTSRGVCIMKAKRGAREIEVRVPTEIYETLRREYGRIVGRKFDIVAGSILVPAERETKARSRLRPVDPPRRVE
jgi:hypothetical protein